MKKLLSVFSLFLLLTFSVPANADLVGSKCSNSGATLKRNGISYVCKKTNGKLIWKKAPELTEAQKQRAWTDCLIARTGNAGFSNDDLINASRYCRQKLGFGY